jgi:hypothetical protein
VNRPIAAAEVPEAQCLLRRQIHHDEAVGAGLFRILEHALLAVAQQRVVVSHKQDWRLESTLSRIADHLQHILGVDAVLKGLLKSDRVRNRVDKCVHVANDSTYSVRGLDRRAVGDGVGEGHTKLDDVCRRQLLFSCVSEDQLLVYVPAPPASIPSMISGVSWALG